MSAEEEPKIQAGSSKGGEGAGKAKPKLKALGRMRPRLGAGRQHQTMLDMNMQAAHKRWMGSDQKEDQRVMKDVTAVETKELSAVILFGKGEIAVNILRNHLKREGRLEQACALELISKATAVLKEEPNVLQLEPEISVIGDIHGQYYDLMNLIEQVGDPEDTSYLFLGDYVDRGMFGLECVFLLFAYKILYPKTFFMLRGNHESREITEYFNFQEECLVKYNEEIYDAIMKGFDCLPLAAIVKTNYGRFLCTHGGLGPGLQTIDDITACNRFQEPPESGAFCDLLWSDPIDYEEYPHMTDKEYDTFDYLPNDARGVGWVYGKSALRKFLSRNDLVCLVRAHEVQQYGYTEHKFRESMDTPLAVTVFSAPNYCDMYENRGGIMIFEKERYRFMQIAWVEHPYWLPDFMNAFSFSLPYVADNCSNIVLNLLMTVLGEPDSDSEGAADDDEANDQIWQSIREKFAKARQAMPELEKLRKQRADMVLPQLPTPSSDGKVNFRTLKQFDRKNERRPPRRHVARLRRAQSAKW